MAAEDHLLEILAAGGAGAGVRALRSNQLAYVRKIRCSSRTYGWFVLTRRCRLPLENRRRRPARRRCSGGPASKRRHRPGALRRMEEASRHPAALITSRTCCCWTSDQSPGLEGILWLETAILARTPACGHPRPDFSRTCTRMMEINRIYPSAFRWLGTTASSERGRNSEAQPSAGFAGDEGAARVECCGATKPDRQIARRIDAAGRLIEDSRRRWRANRRTAQIDFTASIEKPSV